MSVAIGPFDVINSVSHTKERVITEHNEKDFKAFIVMRGLSYFPDTVFHAAEMNQMPHLDPLLQYDYLFFSLRPKKRWAKWNPKRGDEDLLLLAQFFKQSVSRVIETIDTIGDAETNQILEKLKARNKK